MLLFDKFLCLAFPGEIFFLPMLDCNNPSDKSINFPLHSLSSIHLKHLQHLIETCVVKQRRHFFHLSSDSISYRLLNQD